MATQQDRYQFPALRRRLTLLQQELYEAEKLLDINRATDDNGNVLMRYHMHANALSEEIDELTWILNYADTQMRIPYQWPMHYWLLFAMLAGVSVGLTGLLLLRLGGG